METTSETDRDVTVTENTSEGSLAYLELLHTFSLLDLGNAAVFVKDMFPLRPNILIVISNSCVKAINTESYLYTVCEGKLVLANDRTGSKLDDNSIILFTYPGRIDFISVTTEFQLMRTLILDHVYILLRALDAKTFLGLRTYEEFDVLDTDGVILKTLRPDILKHQFLAHPTHLHVSNNKLISVIGGGNSFIACFPVSGEGGFLYNYKYDHRKPDLKESGTEEFQRTRFFLSSPCCVASDSKGNSYISDALTGIVMKVDQKGNFLQNMYLGNANRPCRIQIDEKDYFYTADLYSGVSSMWIFQLKE